MVRAALSHRLSISVHSTSRTRLACPSCHVRRKPRARTVAILFWIFSDSPARLSHLDDIFIASSRARTRNTWFFFEEKEKNQKIPREKIPFNRSPPSSFIEISDTLYVTRRIIHFERVSNLFRCGKTLPNFLPFVINTAHGRNRWRRSKEDPRGLVGAGGGGTLNSRRAPFVTLLSERQHTLHA